MSEKELEKIIAFYSKYIRAVDKEEARKVILEHLKYGTVDYAADEKGNVIGLCRWNISENGTVARIITLAVDEKWRRQGVAKNFLVRGLKLWKNVKFVEFERELRGDNRRRRIPVEFILKRNIF